MTVMPGAQVNMPGSVQNIITVHLPEGANIAEIQMFDHDEQSLFAMCTRIELPPERETELAEGLRDVRSRGRSTPRN